MLTIISVLCMQMRSLNAIPTVVSCVRDVDVSTRRDAISILAVLCENESDHQQIIQAGGLQSISVALSSNDADTQKLEIFC